MYVIVAGGGKIGYYLTKTLINEGHEVLLIEKNKRKVDTYSDRFGACVLQGDACEASILVTAGVERADVIVSVTGDDEDNLVVCQMAKQQFHVPQTIARVNNPKNEDIFRLLGVDSVINSTNVVLNIIEQSITSHRLIHVFTLKHAEMGIIESHIDANSPVAGVPINGVNWPPNTALTGIIRHGQLIIPTADTVMMPGDDVIALASTRAEGALREIFLGSLE